MTASRGPTPQDDEKPFKAHHTWVQRAMLLVNVAVVLACFVGAGTMIYLKRVRESFVAAPTVTYATTTTSTSGQAPSPSSTTASVASDPSTTVPGITAPPETFPAVDPKAENFLITGSDNDACVDPNSPWAGAVEGRENIGDRSDTIMVLRIDPTTKAAAVLSFPRDLYVQIPGKAPARINTTFQKGRYDLMAQTLDQDFGVQVDHFVQIDFCAFKTIVDAVGGVPVPLTNPIRDKNTGIDIEDVSQCHEFHGDEALAYVRSRHLEYKDTDGVWKPDNSSDYGRITRQQDFMRRMLQAANKKGLYSPSVIRGLIQAVQKYIVFDAGFSIDDMLSFAGLLREIEPAGLNTYQIQAKGAIIGGNDVLIPQIDGTNMTAILNIFRGKAALAAAPAQVADTTTSTPPSTEPATTTSSSTTTTVGAGPLTPGRTSTTSTSTTSITSTSTTSTTVAPVATNPEDITHGIVPDKNATC
jgi:LCP family protein required for cell wall assembly